MRLALIDKHGDEITLRGLLRSLFSKPLPPPEPGTVAWYAARDSARLRGQIARHLAEQSPWQK